MRYQITIATIFFGIQLCFGQQKDIVIPIDKLGHTAFWFKFQQERFIKAGLDDLVTSNDSLHFRISTDIQAVDIWTTDFKIFYGGLTNFTTSYDADGYKKLKPGPEKFFSSKVKLDTTLSEKLYTLLHDLSVFSMPTGDSILGWRAGEDGVTYSIEYSTPLQYTFKDYWSPSRYKEKIHEAGIIDSVINRLETTLEMKKSFKAFIKSLPNDSYYVGGPNVSLKIKETGKKRKKVK